MPTDRSGDGASEKKIQNLYEKIPIFKVKKPFRAIIYSVWIVNSYSTKAANTLKA